MRLDKAVARCAHVVDRSLRKCFPDDFDARCMYAAFGMHQLARKLGHRSIIVGGDFTALTVATDNREANLQGYGSSDGDYAHYWCEIDDHTVDLGPSYLSVNSRFPAVTAPLVMWPVAKELPPSLNYYPKIRYSPDVKPMFAPDVMKRLEDFLATCERKFSNLSGQPKALNWIATGPKSIAIAASKGDLWARGTHRIERADS